MSSTVKKKLLLWGAKRLAYPLHCSDAQSSSTRDSEQNSTTSCKSSLMRSP